MIDGIANDAQFDQGSMHSRASVMVGPYSCRVNLRQESVGDRAKRLCVVGTLPPPVHGAATLNAHLLGLIEAQAGMPRVINTAAASLGVGSGFRLFARAAVLIPALWKFSSAAVGGRIDRVYLGLSGGIGQIFEAAVVGIARLMKIQLYLHHYSYSYVMVPNRISTLLMRIAGKGAIHIAPCDDMKVRLRTLYPSVNRVDVVSFGATRHLATGPVRVRGEVKVVGFLGNISLEKGILEFLAVCEQLTDLDIRGRIAGPIVDRAVEQEIIRRASATPGIALVGPVYGETKLRFLDEIDLLLFPSHYSHETDPTVVHEALSAGIPVIAWQRGCISAWLTPECGLVVDASDAYVPRAVQQVRTWRQEGSDFAAVSEAARSVHERYRKRELDKVHRLIDELCR